MPTDTPSALTPEFGLEDHEAFTRMLFEDALVGLGATRASLAYMTLDEMQEAYVPRRLAILELTQ